MKAWKVILATLVIFCAGLVVGGLVVREMTPPDAATTASWPGSTHLTQLLHRMDRDLGLTPDQDAQVKKIISTSQERIRKLWKPVAPEMSKETASACAQIRALLTPDQQAQFDILSRSRSSRGGHGDHEDKGKGHDAEDFDLNGATNPVPQGN